MPAIPRTSERRVLYVRYLEECITVDSTRCRTVAALIEKVKRKFSHLLDVIPLDYLTLEAFSGQKLRPGLKISLLIRLDWFLNSESTPLLVKTVDPTSHSSMGKGGTHRWERVDRWIRLISALTQPEYHGEESSQDESSEGESTYPILDWCRVSHIFEPIMHDYTQAVKEVPLGTILPLHKHLEVAMKSMGTMAELSPSKRLHLIVPILLYVSSLFGPEDPVRLDLDVRLCGRKLMAIAHFDIMLQRYNKRVCIVEPKCGTMRQAMGQALVGMEVMSDVRGLNTVCGLVTNYDEWIFLRSHNDKIEHSLDTLSHMKRVPNIEDLKRIAGKIYAMLSED